MPRLNSLGEAVMGVGGGGITSIDGVEVAALVGFDSGDWDWLDDTTIVGKADLGGGYEIYTIVPPGGSTVQVGDGESTYLWAGGSVWTAYAAIFPGTQSNVAALEFPLAGVGDVAEDGWSALVTNFATDSNISVYDETGVLQNSVSVTVFPENGVIRLRGEVLSYAEAGAPRVWKLRDRDTNAVLPLAQRTSEQTVFVPVTVGSSIYVLERDVVTPGEMLTIRLATAAQGYVITNDGIHYNPDVVWLSGTTVRVAYSTGQAELPDELVFHDINLATGAHSIATIVAGAPVFVAQSPLTVSPLPASAVPGVSSLLSEGLYRQKVIDQNGLMTRPWYLALQQVARAANGPVNLNNVTGVLDQDNGGTGNTSGTTDVAVSVDPDGALDGNGQIVTPLAVRVDNSTIIINGSNNLEATGGAVASSGGVGFPGMDGDDGLTFVIPGPPGPTGATGAAGSAIGPPGLNGDDQELLIIPGPKGDAGAAGTNGAGGLIGIQTITATGAGTYTPTGGTLSVVIELQGAGGGGGGVASPTSTNVAFARGGGGGGYVRVRLTTAFSGASYSVGAKGTGGTAGTNNGTVGGDTVFTATGGGGTVYTASGGAGGLGAAGLGAPQMNAGVTAGGTATNGTINRPGDVSVTGIALAFGIVHSGKGGSSLYGAAGGPSFINGGSNGSVAGVAATGKGAGGSGAVASGTGAAAAGGDGSDGLIVIWEYA